MDKYMSENLRTDQFSMLSGRLEMFLNNDWNSSNKNGIISTANTMKRIVNKESKSLDKRDVNRFVDLLIKAKVKAVMENDSQYHDVCTKLDSIISNVKKYR